MKTSITHLPRFQSISIRNVNILQILLIKKPLILISLLFLQCYFLNAQTIYVDAANNSGIENGSKQNPFNTVTEGINAANSGDSVYIFAGYYPENSQQYCYLKDGLVITGQDSSSVIINTGFINADASMNYYTEVSNVNFKDFRILTGDGTSTIVIKKCRFQYANYSAADGYTFIIENCTIDEGIRNVSGSCYLFVKNNIISDGRIEDSGGAPPGIEAHIIENNVIYNSGLSYPEEAVIRATSTSITLLNNIITCTGTGSGVYLTSGTPTNIIDNHITLNNGNPIVGTYAIQSSVGMGIAKGNHINGGYVGYKSSSMTELFENNTIINSNTGFISNGAEIVRLNTIKYCNHAGMVLDGLRGPVSENIVSDNDSIGILFIREIDLGGGQWNGVGRNVIKNNGYCDLVITYDPPQPDTIYVQYNAWDHETLADILQYDICNVGGSSILAIKADGFIVKPTPSALNFPNDNSTLISFNPEMVWFSSERAETYWLQISTDNSFVNTVVDSANLADTSFSAHLDSSTTYFWRVRACNIAGCSNWSNVWSFTTGTSGLDNLSSTFSFTTLYQNQPNPFRGSTIIRFLLKNEMHISLMIYDINGKKIKTLTEGLKQAGEYQFEFNAGNLPTGVYWFGLQAGERVITRKMIVSE